ncbi:hypothetical protein B0T17DRAFT_523784 [Bombardia bombarda]|uniref:Uncharacterized protein n=1 Tax=Bombardia bombarda TaxID=252184 RepID=A0AA39X7L3_9PEZI|nr:hypothetical protein B0T17DRAFT_523784 [Bombardia bombarda]
MKWIFLFGGSFSLVYFSLIYHVSLRMFMWARVFGGGHHERATKKSRREFYFFLYIYLLDYALIFFSWLFTLRLKTTAAHCEKEKQKRLYTH